jgi:iron complex transport system ATP-binding protein
MTAPVLRADDLAVAYGERSVLEGLGLGIERGRVTALIGPNGSGKSTLLRTMARLLEPSAGVVHLDGEDLHRLPAREVARRLAILPQAPATPASLTVGELVEQGRFPHAGALRMLRRQDHEAVHRALADTGMEAYAGRSIDELSGGERQRAWIALALAQDAPILLLDEPTTFLDLGHQLDLLELVARLNRTRELTVLVVLHDLNLAAAYADRLVALAQGRIVADGAPAEVLTEELVARVFGVRSTIVTDPVTGAPVCLPYAER